MQSTFIVLSVICSLIGPVVGVISILQGRFKPQRMTRLLFFLTTSLFFFSLLAQGDKSSIYLAAVQFGQALLLFLLSLSRGMGGTNKSDFVVLASALFTLTIWKTTGDAFLALIMSMVTDFLAMIPTLLKTWRLPETEDWKYYFADVCAGFFSILAAVAVNQWQLTTLAFPIYIFLINLTNVVLILSRRSWLKSIFRG